MRPLKPDFKFGIVALALGLTLFVGFHRYRKPQPNEEVMLSVVPPIPLQVLAAGGDRFLAANAGVWRALMTGGQQLPRDSLAALAKVQEDASFLNPGHEDNYTTATALLPWEGFVGDTQTILRRAVEVRKYDVYAPFFYGFNEIHFLGDAKDAYRYGMIAASYAPDQGTREALIGISAAWLERGNDPVVARSVIALLAGELHDPELKKQLEQRVARQRIISELQDAVSRYTAKHGNAPKDWQSLIEEGYVATIPEDPLGTVVFVLQADGKVGFRGKRMKQAAR